jgi:hypothetical protein
VVRTELGGGLEVASREDAMFWQGVVELNSMRHEGFLKFGVPRAL